MRKSLALLTLVSFVGFAWLSLAAAPLAHSPTSPEDELLRDATLVFERATAVPNAAIPAHIMLRARGIFVIPAAERDGELYYGAGVFSAREGGLEEWTPPAIVAFQGAIPIELEVEILDFILLPMSGRGLNYLTQERYAAPLVNPIAAGPLGHDGQVRMNADVLGYLRFGEYFAGVTIDAWEITGMRSSNMQLYGRPYSTDEIVRGAGFFQLPGTARRFRQILTAYFREMS
jgi:lipid-binding SYLF domain-containing protein